MTDGYTERISAVVVNWNAGEHLVRCIESLRAEGIADVVVVDNASTDDSIPQLVRSDPDVAIVQTGTNLGFGTGANRGVQATRRELVLVSNADIVVEPGSLKALVAALDREPAVGVVGPRVLDISGDLYPSVRTFPALGDSIGHAFLGFVAPRNRWTRRYRMLDWDHSVPAPVDWVSGSCFLARRRLWDAIGGFDEAFFMYAEDVDLCWRARQAGWEVAYEPAATVVHAHGRSTSQAPYRMIAEHHRSLFRFARRTTTGWRRAALPLVAAGLAVRTVLAWIQHAARAVRTSGLSGGA